MLLLAFKIIRKTWILLLLVFALPACAPTPAALPTSTALRAGALTPYLPPTLTLTPTLAVTLPAPTETPAPTPTPFTYTVKKGDTMGGIAFNYGLSLDQLLAANPTVQPRMLSVGTVLIIPLEGELPTAVPQPTSLPLPTAAPLCYSQADGGMWCFLPVTNDQAQAVESLTATISLVSAFGENLGSQPASALLDLLRPGETLPLVAYFPAPIAGEVIPQVGPLSALPVPEGDSRYLPASFQPTATTLSADGLSAHMTGEVILPQGDPAAEAIWLAGVAFDAQDRVIGARKWEMVSPCSSAAQEAGTPQPEAGCSQLRFEGDIYSLGPAIKRVEIFVEARP
jgi:LysM repeat protein